MRPQHSNIRYFVALFNFKFLQRTEKLRRNTTDFCSTYKKHKLLNNLKTPQKMHICVFVCIRMNILYKLFLVLQKDIGRHTGILYCGRYSDTFKTK